MWSDEYAFIPTFGSVLIWELFVMMLTMHDYKWAFETTVTSINKWRRKNLRLPLHPIASSHGASSYGFITHDLITHGLITHGLIIPLLHHSAYSSFGFFTQLSSSYDNQYFLSNRFLLSSLHSQCQLNQRGSISSVQMDVSQQRGMQHVFEEDLNFNDWLHWSTLWKGIQGISPTIYRWIHTVEGFPQQPRRFGNPQNW